MEVNVNTTFCRLKDLHTGLSGFNITKRLNIRVNRTPNQDKSIFLEDLVTAVSDSES